MQGRFEILSLSGSFAISENGGVRSRTGGISVSLAGPDGRVVGGGVAGLLLAASPIQIVVGSFLPNVFKEHKRRANQESTFSPVPASGGVLTSAKPISQATPPDDGCENLTSSLPAGQVCGGADNSSMTDRPPNPNPTPFKVVGWPADLQSAEHKPSPDINVCLSGE
ncbi:AT-hook motif nuclear-localized protein 10 [Ananas comosus]|uniref:AT-hook motif nuclear-localized protein n=1 Tax=Ananas comosus TaxID=4615 RepID=A0A199UFC5_ANACO|nr:AT-hook motif nuclear-localized protein 10 [Ananas comosus]